MYAPKRNPSSYPGEQAEKGKTQWETNENQQEQETDEFFEYTFDDYNTLYCVPNEAAECFDIFSQDTLDQLNEELSDSEKYPPVLNFSSVHAMRQYLDGKNLNGLLVVISF